VLILTAGFWVQAVMAQSGPEILDESVAAGADVETLKAESQLLGTISQGVALSLAQCEGMEGCEPAVNKAELEELVATVEQRINGLVPRQSEAGVEDLLVAYASVRDTYTQQLGRLGEIAPEPEAAAEEGDAFAAGPAAEDVDESLSDEPAGDEGVEPEAPQ